MLDKIWKPGNFEEVHFFSCIRVWFWIVVKTTIKTVEIIRIACVLFFFFWYLRLYVTYHGWKIWSCGLTPHNNCVNNYVINWKSLIHWHRNLLITSTIITNNLLRIQQGIQPPLRHNLHNTLLYIHAFILLIRTAKFIGCLSSTISVSNQKVFLTCS